MKEILRAIGWQSKPLSQFLLVALFVINTYAFLLLGEFIRTTFFIHPFLYHLIAWGIWFTWQGFIFPARRKRLLVQSEKDAYKSAFWTDIFLGVSAGVSQMLSPIYQGSYWELLKLGSFRSIVGVIILGLGILLLYKGFITIGLAGAGFLFEYQGFNNFKPTTRGIYGYIRHPLKFGGALISVGATLIVANNTAMILALINLGILPIYKVLEDRRQILMYGKNYEQYCKSIPAFIPQKNLWS